MGKRKRLRFLPLPDLSRKIEGHSVRRIDQLVISKIMIKKPHKRVIIIIIIIITLLISLKRLFSLIYNVKYLKLSFPKIPLKNAVLF